MLKNQPLSRFHKIYSVNLPAAEASCAAAIRTAQDVVHDVGPAAKKSGGLLQLAKFNANKNPERDAQRLLVDKLELALTVPVSFLDTGKPSLVVPTLKLRDWAQWIVNHNLWHMLSGLKRPDAPRCAAQWTAFWKKFRMISPGHSIFQRADRGEVDLSRCAAILVHGDEGRSRRRTAIMILSWHSILGQGTGPLMRSKDGKDLRRQYAKLLPNFTGHTYCTRYLLAALTKASYTNDNEYIFDSILETICLDLEFMAKTGVRSPFNEQFWMVMVHVCGDWPFLAKSGYLNRSFNNIPKRAGANRREPPKGVCHMCRAGQDGVPFEQIQTRRPIWLETVFEQSPFAKQSPFLRLDHVPGQSPAIWAFDVFHSFHLGVGRNFIGSVLALYSTLEPRGGVDERFELLSAKFLAFCRGNKLGSVLTKITKETIQWPTTGQYPSAGWHKGAVTTVVMKWIEHRHCTEDFSEEPLLELAGEACVAINKCLAMMYESSVMLEPDDALQIAGQGLRFLRRYGDLAARAKNENRALFVVMPKHHIIQKMMLTLMHQGEKQLPSINPIALSVQQDEDFIGRPSRLSRRITSRTPVMVRLMRRYLQAAYAQYIDGGYLMRLWCLALYGKSMDLRPWQVILQDGEEKKWAWASCVGPTHPHLSTYINISYIWHHLWFHGFDKPRVCPSNLGYYTKPWKKIRSGGLRYIYMQTGDQWRTMVNIFHANDLKSVVIRSISCPLEAHLMSIHPRMHWGRRGRLDVYRRRRARSQLVPHPHVPGPQRRLGIWQFVRRSEGVQRVEDQRPERPWFRWFDRGWLSHLIWVFSLNAICFSITEIHERGLRWYVSFRWWGLIIKFAKRGPWSRGQCTGRIKRTLGYITRSRVLLAYCRIICCTNQNPQNSKLIKTAVSPVCVVLSLRSKGWTRSHERCFEKPVSHRKSTWSTCGWPSTWRQGCEVICCDRLNPPPLSPQESKVATEQPEVAGPSEPSEVPTDEESDDVPIPENWGMQRLVVWCVNFGQESDLKPVARQKRGSLIRPIQLPEHLLEPARLAGYGGGPTHWTL